MKRICSLLATTLICIFIFEACNKSSSVPPQASTANFAKEILGKWKLKTLVTIANGEIQSPPIKDTECYIFNTDTIGVDKTLGASSPFVYKVLKVGSIEINTDKCVVQIKGLKMHLERFSTLTGVSVKTVMDFEKDEMGSLYEILLNPWKINHYTKTNGADTIYDGSGDRKLKNFQFQTDTTLTYFLGSASNTDSLNKGKCTLLKPINTGIFQYQTDSTFTSVTIIDPRTLLLNMVFRSNPNYRGKLTLTL